MAEKFKVTYFNIRGLAEPIRYILAYSGADFEDNRIAKADWPALKETLPYKKLPLLEVDGKVLNQSISICRYLGQKFDLENEDIWTRALLEALVDNLRDLNKKVSDMLTLKTPEAKKEFDTALDDLFKQLDLLAPEGYFYGSKATWVDIYFAGICDTIESYIGEFLKTYPNLVTLCENIRSTDKVSNYLQNRPPPESFN